jgi:Peptidase A4 family
MNHGVRRATTVPRLAQIAVGALLISLLAGCASTAAVQSPTTLPTAITTSAPISAPAATATPTSDTSVRSADSAMDAIKQVIQQSNQEQQQALAAHNPTLMRDTATSAYYSQAVQGLNDLVTAGVSEIELVKLDWGPITLQGTTRAQATTTETWRTTFGDGSTLQQVDTNVYTLVLESDAWKVQDDQHPDSQRVQPPQAPQATAPAPVAPDAEVDVSLSRNWAGYAASGGSFTAVSGTWPVPSVSAGRTAAADATWVGIGGVSSRDLIQAGTAATVQSGRVRYTAWIELLPQVSQPVPLVVSAGDTVSVAINEQSSDRWQILIHDTTTGQSYQKRVTYASSHSSAEWVEEAPAVGQRALLPLDNFGTITFTDATTVEDGQPHSIAQAGGQAITMARGTGQPAAQPSALGDDGASFSVTRTTTATPRSVLGAGSITG